MKKILTLVFLSLCGISMGYDTPIKSLVLTGNANGGGYAFTNVLLSESDPIFTNWYVSPALSSLMLGGTTNILTDDGTNLLRNGILIAGSGSGTGNGFPLTNNVSASNYNITAIGTAQGSVASFGTFSGGNFSGGNMTLSGNLNVSSTLTYNVVQVINTGTVVNVYAQTNYITTDVYSTNNVSLVTNVVYTETRYSTNLTEYNTYVNIGGWYDGSKAAWISFPNWLVSNGTAIATGAWDFTGASVTGITSGSGSGFPLTENGDLAGYSLTNGFFAGDGSGLTNLTGVATGTPIYVELDPSFASVSNLWYGILTNVQSTAVTGAVTSVNGIDGDVVIAGATNSGQTIYVASGGDVYLASNQTFTGENIMSGTFTANTITTSALRVNSSEVVLGLGAGGIGVAIGKNARAAYATDVAIGNYSVSYAGYGVSVGDSAGLNVVNKQPYTVGVGYHSANLGVVSYGTCIGAYSGYYSVSTGSVFAGAFSGDYTRGMFGTFLGWRAGLYATGDYLSVVGNYEQRRYHDAYLTNAASTVPRVVESETTQLAGDLILYDPNIDGIGIPYTNNTVSGKSITFNSGTNKASIKCDFNTGFFIYNINGNVWSNNAP